MATSYKVLGQLAPTANTNTDLYIVPSATSTVCSTLAICNRGNSATIRVAVRPGNASITNQHYIVYDTFVNQYDTIFLTLGITLAQTDVITVNVSTSTISLSLFGSEIT